MTFETWQVYTIYVFLTVFVAFTIIKTKRKLFNDEIENKKKVLESMRKVNEIKKETVEGLNKVIDSSVAIYDLNNTDEEFYNEILRQLNVFINSTIGYDADTKNTALIATKDFGKFYIMASVGEYSDYSFKPLERIVSNKVLKDVERVREENRNIYYDNYFVLYIKSRNEIENIIYMRDIKPLSDLQKNLIDIFTTNVSLAFDNFYLKQEVENTQKEIIFKLGEVSEMRSKETGNHVKRVGEYSKILAVKCGINIEKAEIIGLAASLHDIGKVGIPDKVLKKPGRLDDDEFETMKNHTVAGYDMLKSSSRKIIRAAAIIALQHHEKFDGTGYPMGLKGDEIHIYARITAIADVFDALVSNRIYKDSWNIEEIIKLFKSEKRKQFDPELVNVFLKNLNEFLDVHDKLSDYYDEE